MIVQAVSTQSITPYARAESTLRTNVTLHYTSCNQIILLDFLFDLWKNTPVFHLAYHTLIDIFINKF